MRTYETQTARLGIIEGQHITENTHIAIIEPPSVFSAEARKGNLYIVVEPVQQRAQAQDACRVVTNTIQKTFYASDSLSVTSSLREAMRAANKALYQHNVGVAQDKRVHMGLTCAVIKGTDLFIAQVMPAQLYVQTSGTLRALPSPTSWNPAHVSVAPFQQQAGTLGVSLSIEPELYRCELHVHHSVLLCTRSLAEVLARDEVVRLLHEDDTGRAVERLTNLSDTHRLTDAHALVVRLAPASSTSKQTLPLQAASLSERGQMMMQAVGAWVVNLGTRSNRAGNTHRSGAPERDAARQRTRTTNTGTGTATSDTDADTDTDLPISPVPRPQPIDPGEPLSQQYERLQQERARPPTATLGEGYPGEEGSFSETPPPRPRTIDLPDSPPPVPPAPYRPRRPARPWSDMPWHERLALPFQTAGATVVDLVKHPPILRKNPARPRPGRRPRKTSDEREKPPFPWLFLVALVLFVALLVVYGTNLSRQSAEQRSLEYLEQARMYLRDMRETDDKQDALQHLENARQALDQVRASPMVTVTNPTLWLPYKEVENEYERGLAVVQRLTFFERPVVLARHPVPNGRFSSLVVPPPTSSITDTFALEALEYIYALDSDRTSARLYRIPRDGGEPEAYLSPNDVVQNTQVGSLQAISWRIDNVVAVDQSQTTNSFGYYFRSGGSWNYVRLGGSEIWVPKSRIVLETYEGNLYFWGAEPGEILKYTSGRYGDLPQLWLDTTTLEQVDLATAVDMAVDGNIYMLLPSGTILVFGVGTIERELVPEEIIPPITAVTRFFVTGPPESGWIYLLDTLNERVIQLDKITGEVVQQMGVRADSPVRLNQLTDIYVDDSGGRPMLYLINGSEIVRVGLPSPPTPFEDGADATPAGE